MLRPTLTVLFALLFSSVSLAQPAKFSLRPKFTVGQETRYKIDIGSKDSTTFQEMKEMNSEQTTITEIGVRMKVTEADPEKGAKADMIYDRMKVKIKGPMGDIVFDSTKPAADDGDNPMAPILRKMIGQTIKVTFDPDGNITEMGGGAGLNPADALSQAMQGLGGGGGMFGPITTAKKAPGEVRVGESWQEVSTMDSPMGRFKITVDKTLTSALLGQADIDMRGRIEADTEGSLTPGMKVTNSSYTGKAAWDLKKGILTSMRTKQQAEFQGTLQGMAVRLKNDATMQVTLDDAAPPPTIPKPYAPADEPPKKRPSLLDPPAKK